MDFVEICNVCAKKAVIKAAKRIINSNKMCHSYSDLNFGITFLEHSVYLFHVCHVRYPLFCQVTAFMYAPHLLRCAVQYNALEYNIRLLVLMTTKH